MWLGQTDAGIASLRLAMRLDPELNPIDRFALALAYFQKGQYGAAIAQAEMNLPGRIPTRIFNRIVLAAAYAQQGDADAAARAAAAIRCS